MDMFHEFKTMIWGELETLRRWGMICDCKEHVDLRKGGVRHIDCDKNSRRLKDAWGHVQDIAATFDEKARTLTEAACESNKDVWWKIRHMMLQSARLLRMRFAYLNDAPWCFVRCDSVAGAQRFIECMESQPVDKHDPYAQDLWRRFQSDVRAVAAGNDVSLGIRKEIKRMEHAG